MIDLAKETVITMNKAPDYLYGITGYRPNLSTLYRWCTAGRNGRVLETVKIGGARFTSAEALDRFFRQLPPITPDDSVGGPPPRTHDRSDDEARRLLGLKAEDESSDDDDRRSGASVPMAA